MHKIAEMVSLVLTAPTIILGLGVIVHWGPSAWIAWRKPPRDRDSIEWLILGVAVGFLGGVLDNAYWGLAWTSDFIGSDSRNSLFNSGVYFNIPFRQLAGVYAAHCHLRSYCLHDDTREGKLRRYWVISVLLGILYVTALLSFR